MKKMFLVLLMVNVSMLFVQPASAQFPLLDPSDLPESGDQRLTQWEAALNDYTRACNSGNSELIIEAAEYIGELEERFGGVPDTASPENLDTFDMSTVSVVTGTCKKISRDYEDGRFDYSDER